MDSNSNRPGRSCAQMDQNLGLQVASTTSGRRAGDPDAAKKSSLSKNLTPNRRADLAPDAVIYSRLSKAIKGVPDVRQARVAALRRAIEEGSYAVADLQIAQVFVSDYASGPGTRPERRAKLRAPLDRKSPPPAIKSVAVDDQIGDERGCTTGADIECT
ncbi:MAG: flagellar biosynthesis anti-sigma factor FlgM [Candidatus Acidiferrales bacterium]